MIKNSRFLIISKNISFIIPVVVYCLPKKINLHLKGYKLKIYYYFYTRKGAYYGIK